ncbi:MAG: hypothetical protein R3250_00175 [Melioribacteraceae bacterium]|nr:hypothetical protein [Melioribacteraceae bacterium]
MIELTKTNESIVRKMVNSGKTAGVIKNAMLALDMVGSAKEAEEYLATLEGVNKGRKHGVIDKMYHFLRDGVRTQAEFYAWIQEHGTESMWKLRKSHDKIRELTNAIHLAHSGAEFTEQAYIEPESAQETASDVADAA